MVRGGEVSSCKSKGRRNIGGGLNANVLKKKQPEAQFVAFRKHLSVAFLVAVMQ